MKSARTLNKGVRAADDANWELIEDEIGVQRLFFSMYKEPDDPAALFGASCGNPVHVSHLLADYDPALLTINTYPRVIKHTSSFILKPKYEKIKRISFENERSIDAQLDDEQDWDKFGPSLIRLPSGFIRSIFEGFGLIHPLRFIVHAIEEISGISGITLCNDQEISRAGSDIRLPRAHYDEIRRAMQRAHNTALNFAARDKTAYATSQLTDRVLGVRSAEAFRPGVEVLHDQLSRALSGKRTRSRSTENAEAAVKAVRDAADDLAAKAPTELYELNREIELVSLTRLIEIFRLKMEKSHSENHWQKFLTANPFILRLAFGYPITIFGEQVSVGGGKFTGGGTKIADYLVRSGLMGNVSLIEIKRPSTSLLDKKEYRGKIYSPSKELSGSVTQVLDQRFRLQQEITQKKENEGVHDIWAYAVQCTVIAGKIPADNPGRKSLELFRSNLRDVSIVTFDELLDKLVSLQTFLIADSSANTIEPVLLADDADDEEEDADWGGDDGDEVFDL